MSVAGSGTRSSDEVGGKQSLGAIPPIWLGVHSGRAVPAMVAYWALLVAVALAVGATQDYPLYMEQWAAILAGKEPWSAVGDGGNVYGPGHNAFALAYYLHPLLPKLIFVGCWIYSYFIVARRTGGDSRLNLLVFVFLFVNPFFVFLVAAYGSHDIFIALLMLLAVDLVDRRRRSLMPALLLAVAALTKFYPLALAPFLAVRGRRVDWRFAGAFVFFLALGLGASALVWHSSVADALKFASARPSKLFSIFFFLNESRFSPLAHTATAQAVTEAGTWITAGALIVAFLAYDRSRMRLAPGALLALLVTFTFYKVGELQFFVPIFVLLIYVHVRAIEEGTSDRLLVLAGAALYGALNLFMIWYVATEGSMLFPEVRATIGLPIFLISLLLCLATARLALRPPQLAAR